MAAAVGRLRDRPRLGSEAEGGGRAAGDGGTVCNGGGRGQCERWCSGARAGGARGAEELGVMILATELLDDGASRRARTHVSWAASLQHLLGSALQLVHRECM